MCFLSFFDRTIFQNNWYPLSLGGMKNTPSQQNLHLCIALILGGGEIDPFSSSCLPEFRVCRGRKMPSFYQKKHLKEFNPLPKKNLPSWCFQKGAKELDVSKKSLHRNRATRSDPPGFDQHIFSYMEAAKNTHLKRKII